MLSRARPLFASQIRLAAKFGQSQLPATSLLAKFFSTKYAPSHEWIKVDGDIGTVGITAHAADQLGDVVYVELPDEGADFSKGESFGSVESVKAASDVYTPVSGEIVAANEALSDTPGTVNESAEGDGWFMKIKLSDPSELDDLMDLEAYQKHCDSS
uniref:Glycine cleavage system H protein n=1 Tax=Fibrocapsa japonica TaxID=94617 RepID=A0A7S2V4N2_9STRA|mmetsp:Transcript_7247/g.10873  ORF Transcript_7247/g.10873 Transcript_7247/m.10873 type:complete len:157 (+) Transcript_7247:100-570(+)|eukprot:CAMPEP_0113934558 /NCGR_PEP_ID=MMETSP1339-20121228/1884_1 /TAXON_ID=94617 /ORGANISM="Fibrocapsa japonica" /LENGTH=156 /DNA_ID=CAMNT_0000936415 /DNA_START=95 /DNA_END=565 /DNA_ORIENTATION=- /assembly_acc=CAM_ASM_000762